MGQFLPAALLLLTIVCSSQAKESAEQEENLGALPSIFFKTKYYTDYYSGENGHKLYREVTGKFSKTRLDCNYVGDRQIVAGLIGAANNTINEALKAMLPKKLIKAKNVTTDEIDNLIDECINNPIEVPKGTRPALKRFLKKINKGFKNLGSYMFIFPGTKWCGAGDVARTYSDLGRQNITDACCREHDHSKENLLAGQTKEGLKNPLFYTMTNCDDDNKFLQCLRDAETAHAGAVGTMFFNLLKTKCFAKRKNATCVEKLPLSPCQKYEYDNSTEERYQIFDPTQFVPKTTKIAKYFNKFLFKVPGIDNILNLF